jgi:GNAT superfamily N-acetyltransferase
MDVVSLADRPDLRDRLPFGAGWPQFVFHDPVAARYLPVVDEAFPDLNLVVLDGGEIVAGGWAVRIRWDGTLEDLPAGWDGALARAARNLERGEEPNTLVTMAAEVVESHRGRGLSPVVLRALLARAWGDALAPVRPTAKAAQPEVSMEAYVARVRGDGLPEDPWLRTHVRLGGEILAVAPESMVVEGCVADWEAWTGLRFERSGKHRVPGALALVDIDVDSDRGRYVEPNVWVRHGRRAGG